MKDVLIGNTVNPLTRGIEKMLPAQLSGTDCLIGLGIMVLGTIVMTAIENGQGINLSAEMPDGSKYSFSTVQLDQGRGC